MVAHSPLPHHRTCGSAYGGSISESHEVHVGWVFAVRERRVGLSSRVSIRCGFTALCLPKACRSRMASAIPPSRTQALLTLPIVRAFVARATTTPLLTSARPSRRLTAPLVTQDSQGRSPVISSTAFHARPPDLPPVPLMDMGFAIICSLARRRRPHIRFLFIGSRLCSTLLSGPASRRVLFHPCASLTLRLHQTGWRTFTS